MSELYEDGFRDCIPRLAKKLGVADSVILNLLRGEMDDKIADKLGVVPAALDCIFQEEPETHSDIANLLYMVESDLHNLLDYYNNEKKGISVGLVLGYLIGKLEGESAK